MGGGPIRRGEGGAWVNELSPDPSEKADIAGLHKKRGVIPTPPPGPSETGTPEGVLYSIFWFYFW